MKEQSYSELLERIILKLLHVPEIGFSNEELASDRELVVKPMEDGVWLSYRDKP